jgi:hypothetical protein
MVIQRAAEGRLQEVRFALTTGSHGHTRYGNCLLPLASPIWQYSISLCVVL